VGSPRELEVPAWECLVEYNVCRERGPSVDPLEQVVAGQRVLRHATFQTPEEGVDIVDPLADVDPGSEQILIHIGHRPTVDVDSGVTREDSRESRCVATCRVDFDTWLHDRVASHDATRLFVELRAIQRMREDTDEPLKRPARQGCVCVEGQHKADPPEALLLSGMEGKGSGSPRSSRLKSSSLPRFRSHAIQHPSAGFNSRGRWSTWKGPGFPPA